MIPRDSTSIIRHVFIQDSTSTTGAGKTGLAYDTSGLTCYYIYPGGTATAITLENITTLGTYQAPTSSAHMRFKEVSATNMPGWYEIHLHNDWASTANGRTKVNLCLKGASGMAPLNLSMDLIGFGIQSFAPDVSVYDKTGFELTSSERSSIASAVWSSATRTLTSFGALVSDIWSAATRTLTSYSDSSGVTTLLSRIVGTIASGTHQPQSGDSYARIGSNGSGLTSLGDPRIANLDAAVSSRLAASGYTAPDNAGISAIKATTDKLATTVEADGSEWRFTANALEQAPTGSAPTAGQIADAVWDELLIDHQAAGTTGEALATSGSGGIDPSLASAIQNTYAIVSSDAVINVVSPVADGTTVSINRGYDYMALDGRAIEFTSRSWPVLTGASIAMVKRDSARTPWHVMTVAASGAGVAQTVRLQLTSSETSAMKPGTMPLRVSATLANGDVVDLLDAEIVVV